MILLLVHRHFFLFLFLDSLLFFFVARAWNDCLWTTGVRKESSDVLGRLVHWLGITETIVHLSFGESGGYLPPLRWITRNRIFWAIARPQTAKNGWRPRDQAGSSTPVFLSGRGSLSHKPFTCRGHRDNDTESLIRKSFSDSLRCNGIFGVCAQN